MRLSIPSGLRPIRCKHDFFFIKDSHVPYGKKQHLMKAKHTLWAEAKWRLNIPSGLGPIRCKLVFFS